MVKATEMQRFAQLAGGPARGYNLRSLSPNSRRLSLCKPRRRPLLNPPV